MIHFKKFYFDFFIICFILVGTYLCLGVGITHDEFHDYNVWLANKNIISNYLFNTNYDTSFLSGTHKFYGSGFHFFSSLIEIFSSRLPLLETYSDITRIILLKHFSTFLLFVISGLVFKKILKIIINNNDQANLGTILYLIYPYLLGHSFFNVKDIPFLTIWLICTYFLIKIIRIYFIKKIISKKNLIFLSLFTSYLLSIRISGVLIFLQYLIFILTLSNVMNFNFFNFIKKFIKEILISIVIIFTSYILLQPSYWENPLLFFESILYMSQHVQTVCTLTLKECMGAQNLPASYLPIWFFFKLPIIILFGIFLFFVVEKKINKDSLNSIILSSLGFSVLSIIFLLIIFNVNLYDELRQVMFLVPLIFIISLTFLNYFSKRIFNFSLIFFIIFFVFQNIKIYPYNYIWINNFSHITKVQNVFELDYWGVSTKTIADYIENNNIKNNHCFITNRNHTIKSLVPKKQCFKDFKYLHSNNKRPFYVALLERSLNKGTPNNCKLVYEETRNINFSNEKLSLAKVFKCD